MSEEAEDGDFDMAATNGGAEEAEEEGRVLEWETGLPSGDELVPLSQPLVPPELAVAFRIPLEPAQTLLDVDRFSRQTLDNIRRISSSSPSSLRSFHPLPSLPAIIAGDDDEGPAAAESSRKTRRIEGSTSSAAANAAAAAAAEEADFSAALRPENSSGAQKRPRLVWTPQLHKRFVDVVAHVGIKNAVPKTIMQLMNVEGLTRENVASHLQKYRLYLKRMQGLSDEGPSPSDPLFASAPVPPNLREQPVPVPVPMHVPYAVVPVPAFGMTHPYGHGGPMGMGMGMGMGMVPIGNHQGAAATNGFGPIVTYPHVNPSDK
uniref:HTH myb-type domain-containing protein n=1 Tax=Ananas comosus var. bracteatus TaxID=296719 RepID=A0A6V7PCS2_ANACO|nr:unnamed protein product [Ananas comosus var. bracteatus]